MTDDTNVIIAVLRQEIKMGFGSVRDDMARMMERVEDHEARLRDTERCALTCRHDVLHASKRLETVENDVKAVEDKVNIWGWANSGASALAVLMAVVWDSLAGLFSGSQ